MFDFRFEKTYDVIIEQYIGNALVNQQSISAPEHFIVGQFINLVQQVVNQNQPMKIVMKTPVEIWDKFEHKNKSIWNEVEFKNWRDD